MGRPLRDTAYRCLQRQTWLDRWNRTDQDRVIELEGRRDVSHALCTRQPVSRIPTSDEVRAQLGAFYALARRELDRFRGREIDTAGDGFLATFDGPARAIRCASSIATEVQRLRLQVRAGLHTGECELAGDKVRGIAVHTGARVMSYAGPGEVLVSSTVKDLVAGSDIHFENRGMHTLKGVPGQWTLFAVVH